ncbi:MAG: hypothetical protein AAGF11_07510 [Myxococcota bacterium]
MSDPRLGDHFAAYRDTQGPTAQEQAELWAAVHGRARRGELGPLLDDEAELDRKAPRRRGMLVGIGLGVLAAAAAIVVTIAMAEPRLASPSNEADSHDAANFEVDDPPLIDTARRHVPSRRPAASAAIPTPETETETETKTEPETETEPSSPTPASAPMLPPAIPEPEASATSPAPIPRPRRAKQDPGISDDRTPPSIEVEVELLQSVKRALASNRPERALALLRDHAQRFADGMLTPERDLLEVRALCAVGRPARAERKAAAALAANPRSPWAPQLRRGCASEDRP